MSEVALSNTDETGEGKAVEQGGDDAVTHRPQTPNPKPTTGSETKRAVCS